MINNITLKDFLEKYTAVPQKFINEYWEFYELCKDNIYGIPLEKVMKYLGITDKKKFIERIRAKYELRQDFEIIRLEQKAMKGIQNVHYMLSFECFEKICMSSNTRKGQEYRDYFIMLRKFIDYYKNHISDKIEDLTKTHNFIYILLVNKNKNIFKLGRTKNIRKRLQSYATGKDKHPDIKFIMIVNDDKQVENCVKIFAKAKQYKANKELYQENLNILKSLIDNCANMDKKIKEHFTNKKEYNSYVIFDDSKSIEYLDLNSEVIGWEMGTKIFNKPKNIIKKTKKTKKNSISAIN
jgi:phage anti-repressor protein